MGGGQKSLLMHVALSYRDSLGWGNKILFKWSQNQEVKSIYDKTLSKFFSSGTTRLMTLKIAIGM